MLDCEEDRDTLPVGQRPGHDWTRDIAQLRNYEAWFKALADWYDWHDGQLSANSAAMTYSVTPGCND